METYKRFPVTIFALLIYTTLIRFGKIFFFFCNNFFKTFYYKGHCIRCYECVSRLAPGQTDSCLYGDELNLKRVTCLGPSVCATYHYQSKYISFINFFTNISAV